MQPISWSMLLVPESEIGNRSANRVNHSWIRIKPLALPLPSIRILQKPVHSSQFNSVAPNNAPCHEGIDHWQAPFPPMCGQGQAAQFPYPPYAYRWFPYHCIRLTYRHSMQTTKATVNGYEMVTSSTEMIDPSVEHVQNRRWLYGLMNSQTRLGKSWWPNHFGE